jgi:type I restriction enzyme M protein
MCLGGARGALSNEDKDRSAKHFLVPVKEIEEKESDMSINRALDAESAKDLDELEGML